MGEKKELICIGCPMGCPLTAVREGEEIKISGNLCKIGGEYGVNECTDPRRIITTSINLTDEHGHTVPVSVKTNKDIPKNMIFECLNLIKNFAPQKGQKFNIGDVIIPNILNTGSDIVITRQIYSLG